MFGDRDLISADADQRARTVEYSMKVVKLAADLGSKICCVVPGPVGKTVPTSTPENEWRWAIKGLKEICSFASSVGIRVAIEPQTRFSTYFLNRVDQAVLLADQVGFDCGIAFDPFHMSIEEKDVYKALERCGPYLADFHVTENNRLAPGNGHFDGPHIVRILCQIGYRGGLAMECVPKADRLPPPQAEILDHHDETDQADLESLPEIERNASGAVSDEYYIFQLAKTARLMLPLLEETENEEL